MTKSNLQDQPVDELLVVNKRKDFFFSPNMIFELPINANAGYVYLYLCRCSNKFGTSFPSHKTIGRACKIKSRTTVISAINELIDIGLVEKAHRYREDGKQTSNLYTVYNEPRLLKVAKVEKPSETACPIIEPSLTQNLDTPPIKNWTPEGLHIEVKPILSESESAPAPEAEIEYVTRETEPESTETAEITVEELAKTMEITVEEPAETAEITVEKPAETAEIAIEKPEETVEFTIEKPEETVEIAIEKPEETVEITIEKPAQPDKPDTPPESITIKMDLFPEKKYGEYKVVLLTDPAYNELVGQYGIEKVNHYIAQLEYQIVCKGKKYMNHAFVIRKWAKEDADKGTGAQSPHYGRLDKPVNRFVNFKQREWDYDELERLERQYLIAQLRK